MRYRSRRRLPRLHHCPDCGAAFRSWAPRPIHANCPKQPPLSPGWIREAQIEAGNRKQD